MYWLFFYDINNIQYTINKAVFSFQKLRWFFYCSGSCVPLNIFSWKVEFKWAPVIHGIKDVHENNNNLKIEFNDNETVVRTHLCIEMGFTDENTESKSSSALSSTNKIAKKMDYYRYVCTMVLLMIHEYLDTFLFQLRVFVFSYVSFSEKKNILKFSKNRNDDWIDVESKIINNNRKARFRQIVKLKPFLRKHLSRFPFV